MLHMLRMLSHIDIEGWWRVLKEGGRNAIIDLELDEEQLKEMGAEMEAHLRRQTLNTSTYVKLYIIICMNKYECA